MLIVDPTYEPDPLLLITLAGVFLIVLCCSWVALAHIFKTTPVARAVITACTASLATVGIYRHMGEKALALLLPYAALAVALVVFLVPLALRKLWQRLGLWRLISNLRKTRFTLQKRASPAKETNSTGRGHLSRSTALHGKNRL